MPAGCPFVSYLCLAPSPWQRQHGRLLQAHAACLQAVLARPARLLQGVRRLRPLHRICTAGARMLRPGLPGRCWAGHWASFTNPCYASMDSCFCVALCDHLSFNRTLGLHTYNATVHPVVASVCECTILRCIQLWPGQFCLWTHWCCGLAASRLNAVLPFSLCPRLLSALGALCTSTTPLRRHTLFQKLGARLVLAASQQLWRLLLQANIRAINGMHNECQIYLASRGTSEPHGLVGVLMFASTVALLQTPHDSLPQVSVS
jgi:hypothetical protein